MSTVTPERRFRGRRGQIVELLRRGGRTYVQIATEVNSTPAFVYNTASVLRRMRIPFPDPPRQPRNRTPVETGRTPATETVPLTNPTNTTLTPSPEPPPAASGRLHLRVVVDEPSQQVNPFPELEPLVTHVRETRNVAMRMGYELSLEEERTEYEAEISELARRLRERHLLPIFRRMVTDAHLYVNVMRQVLRISPSIKRDLNKLLHELGLSSNSERTALIRERFADLQQMNAKMRPITMKFPFEEWLMVLRKLWFDADAKHYYEEVAIRVIPTCPEHGYMKHLFGSTFVCGTCGKKYVYPSCPKCGSVRNFDSSTVRLFCQTCLLRTNPYPEFN